MRLLACSLVKCENIANFSREKLPWRLFVSQSSQSETLLAESHLLKVDGNKPSVNICFLVFLPLRSFLVLFVFGFFG